MWFLYTWEEKSKAVKHIREQIKYPFPIKLQFLAVTSSSNPTFLILQKHFTFLD